MPPYKQPVTVHAIRRTGQKSHQILALLYRKFFCIFRIHYGNLINLITQSPVEYVQEEKLPLFQFVKICEERRTGIRR